MLTRTDSGHQTLTLENACAALGKDPSHCEWLNVTWETVGSLGIRIVPREVSFTPF